LYKLYIETKITQKLIKKIAKHGSRAIIVIAKILQEELKPNTVIKINIKVMREA